MNAQLPRRCVIALLASMILALIIGLLAWGPVVLHPAAHEEALPHALTLPAALSLVSTGLWGLRRLDRHPLSAAWSMFFVAVALTGPALAYHRWTSDELSQFAVHLCTGWASTALICAFLAERVDARWSRWPLLLLGFTFATLSACHWLVGELSQGQGDLRSHLLLQCLPLLLAPAGAVRLPGRWTGAGDWYAVLSIDVLVLLAEALSGGLAGPALWAPAAAWLAYRMGAVTPEAAEASLGEGGASSEASTSLNTSG